MRFASEAVTVVTPPLAIGIVACVWGVAAHKPTALVVGSVVTALGLFLLWFFRSPGRTPPEGDGLVLAPADGRVIACETLPDGRRHVAIFLSVLDVHVNRTPVAGVVRRVEARQGAHHHAGSDRAEQRNARVDVHADTVHGPVSWRQVAGLLARRISCRLKEGDEFARAVPFGLIYLGSRMDVFLPPSAALRTAIGRRVRAGESVIAEFTGKDES